MPESLTFGKLTRIGAESALDAIVEMVPLVGEMADTFYYRHLRENNVLKSGLGTAGYIAFHTGFHLSKYFLYFNLINNTQ